MSVGVFRFTFSSHVPLDEAEATLQLATFAAEGVFGPARVRLDFTYHLDTDHRMVVVDGSKEVGDMVVQLYTGLLLREFGEDAIRVERVTQSTNHEYEENKT